MTISINQVTKVVTIEQSDMTQTQTVPFIQYELDLDELHNTLRTLEANEDNTIYSRTHDHNTVVTISGTVLARVLIFLDPYTYTFEYTGTPYAIKFAGANSNLLDKCNLNAGISFRESNSAGLIQVTSGSGVLPADITAIKNAIYDEQMETGFDFRDYMLIMAAALSGKASGMEGTDGIFRNLSDSKNRISVTTDEFGNRTAIVFDLT
jgi:lipoprotein signal peptidase